MPAGERLGVFGGTFDPFHLGHLVAAQDVLEALALDRVLFVPAGLPPHKADERLTCGSFRLRMVQAVVRDDARFDALDLELRREGPSYTVDTLAALREREPDAALFLILGTDQWQTFGSWREPREIARLARLVVMRREGESARAVVPRFPDGAEPPEFEDVPVTRLDLSSTLLRERARAGRSIRYLVPDEVRRIIEAGKLYL